MISRDTGGRVLRQVQHRAPRGAQCQTRGEDSAAGAPALLAARHVVVLMHPVLCILTGLSHAALWGSLCSAPVNAAPSFVRLAPAVLLNIWPASDAGFKIVAWCAGYPNGHAALFLQTLETMPQQTSRNAQPQSPSNHVCSLILIHLAPALPFRRLCNPAITACSLVAPTHGWLVSALVARSACVLLEYRACT